MKEKLRYLPSVDKAASHLKIKKLLEILPREDVIESLREALALERERILSGRDPGGREDIMERIINSTVTRAGEKSETSLQHIINATGIIIHTNLGRAILSEEAMELVKRTACSYSNLEFDVEKGKRGSRNSHLKKYLREMTGAEDSLIVNNNAAALFLVVDTFASGKEVVVSRSELIEIGGSFRLPDILKKSGAIMKEVGCTNKTHPFDYENAINENTAMLLKCHKSNFAIQGFTKEVTGSEMAEIARKHDILSMEDLGSGLLINLEKYGLHGESTVRQVVESGVDLVSFSGDKLLGGPQGGIIVGRSELIQKLAKNPLTRALRLDKMAISAFEGTFALYRDPDTLEEKLPFLKMLSQTPESLAGRIEVLIEKVKSAGGDVSIFSVVPGTSRTGGGAFPVADVPTSLLMIDSEKYHPDKLSRMLLDNDPPILGRIHNDRVVLDLRTVLPYEEEETIKFLVSLSG